MIASPMSEMRPPGLIAPIARYNASKAHWVTARACGETWPIKRLVNERQGAYSSLAAGRPGTPSEGMIYLLFEGGPDAPYTAMQIARFNLSWMLGGQHTGSGEVPAWVLQHFISDVESDQGDR